jgi:hypothetical protein
MTTNQMILWLEIYRGTKLAEVVQTGTVQADVVELQKLGLIEPHGDSEWVVTEKGGEIARMMTCLLRDLEQLRESWALFERLCDSRLIEVKKGECLIFCV